MAKSTKCEYCGNVVDNRAIKAHERAHEKTGDQKLVVTPPFSERLKEAKQKVEKKLQTNIPVSLDDQPEGLSGKKHPATYNIERRQRIAELRNQGLGYRKIGQQMNLHPVRVRKIVKELGL